MIVSLFVVGFFAATQDIATDALAVNLLSVEERGMGNSIQVAGSYMGGIVGGGGMLILFERLGWRNSRLMMAGFILLASIPIWLHQEQTNRSSLIVRGLGGEKKYSSRHFYNQKLC